MFFSLIIFCTFGFTAGQLWQRYRQSNHTSSISTNSAASKMDQLTEHEQDLDMTENVAYGPLKINV